jgi:peptidoglycan/xylan/chitin deacetylase (PgdA/CDA1 family)
MIEAVHLMYHELESPGRKLCRDEPGYVRYVITAEEFRRQLAYLRENGFQCLSVEDAFNEKDDEKHDKQQRRARIVITFDDGCETDLLTAAPLLKEFDANATFYIVAGFLGSPGYLSALQLRELSEQGFDIGSHSMTHAYLPDLAPEELRAEIQGSKARLEEITGREVKHFSCPGGRWSQSVAREAQRAGYATVATSRPGKNGSANDCFALARMAVLRGTSLADFDRICRGRGLLRKRAQVAALSAAKKLLGNGMYEKLRAAVLD